MAFFGAALEALPALEEAFVAGESLFGEVAATEEAGLGEQAATREILFTNEELVSFEDEILTEGEASLPSFGRVANPRGLTFGRQIFDKAKELAGIAEKIGQVIGVIGAVKTIFAGDSDEHKNISETEGHLQKHAETLKNFVELARQNPEQHGEQLEQIHGKSKSILSAFGI